MSILVLVILFFLSARITFLFHLTRTNGLRRAMRNFFGSLAFYWFFWMFFHKTNSFVAIKMLVSIIPVFVAILGLGYYLEKHFGKFKGTG